MLGFRKRTISDLSSQRFDFVSVKNINNEVSYSGRLHGSFKKLYSRKFKIEVKFRLGKASSTMVKLGSI